MVEPLKSDKSFNIIIKKTFNKINNDRFKNTKTTCKYY